jgi:hypothetical protein
LLRSGVLQTPHQEIIVNSKITAAVSVVVGAAVIVALTLWVASFTLFAGATGAGMSTTTLTLLQAEPRIEKVDAGKDGVLTFIEGDLTTVAGADAGELAGSILTVEIAEGDQGEFEARSRSLTFNTPDGQIEVAGLAYYPIGERKLAQAQPVVVSITGGTGKYIGVSGEVQTTHLPDGTFEHVFTFVKR